MAHVTNRLPAAALLAAAITAAPMAAAQPVARTSPVPLAERVALLQRSYPDLIYAVTNNVLRLMNNRTVIIHDDRRRRYLAEQRDPDIATQLAQVYPIGKCATGRKPDFDPGRTRSMAFLRAAYGANKYQVTRTTEVVDWFGTPVRFSSRHGAAAALRRVRAALRQLPAKLQQAVRRPARTLDWVNVPNMERLSVYAFAIAIDLGRDIGDHWQQNRVGPRRKRIRYRNRVPPEVVAAFERHGFIWGGRWHRFETAHFEYRPAMIAIARLAEQRGCDAGAKR